MNLLKENKSKQSNNSKVLFLKCVLTGYKNQTSIY